MAGEFKAPRGTADHLPGDSAGHDLVVGSFRQIVRGAGFGDLNNRRFPTTDCTGERFPGLVS